MKSPRTSAPSLVVCLTLLVLTGCKKSEPTPGPASEPAAEPAAARPAPAKAAPLTIAYSDWPGWVAWDVGLQKGFFAAEGVDVELKWFEYAPSMEAFTAGKVDAVAMTNGDALITRASGTPSVAIVINDFSDGNDMVVARAGIPDVKGLRGKKVGVELGFVDHFLLLQALTTAGLKESDVTLVNVPTDQTPQLLKSGQVDAIAAWQPNSGQALRESPGSKPVYTSADAPGLIYDLLCVSPKSLRERKEDWKKVAKVWQRIAAFIADPATVDEAAKIMAARVGMEPARYKALMGGTHFLGGAEQKTRFADGAELTSVRHSTRVVDGFQVDHGVYKAKAYADDMFDDSLAPAPAALAGVSP
jgi:NitT/TauT family transport system substrate-binding protein